MDDLDVQGVRLAALVHDVGKIAIPTELLLKPGRLRPTEMNLIRDHAAIGGEVHVVIRGKPLRARVVKLPFYKRPAATA